MRFSTGTVPFLFMADAHIRNRTWTNSMLLQGDSYEALNMLKVGADTLVIGGDWFDSNRPSSADVSKTQEFLSTFSQVFYILGNHDNAEPSWVESICGRAVHLDSDGVRLRDGTVLYGIDWNPRQETVKARLENIVSSVQQSGEKSRVYIVMHDAVKELLGYDGTYFAAADWIRQLTAGTSISVLIGHVHTRRTIPLLSDMSNTFIHSPGPLYPASSDQMGLSCCATLVLAGGGLADVDCRVRHYSCIDWTDMAALKAEAERLLQLLACSLPPCLRVRIPASADVDLSGESVPGVVLVISREVDTAGTAAADEISTTAEGLREAVMEAASYDSDIQEMASALMSSDDALATVNGWLDYWKVTRA